MVLPGNNVGRNIKKEVPKSQQELSKPNGRDNHPRDMDV